MENFNFQAVNKAIAGAVGAALVAFLAKKGIVLGPEVNDAVNVLIAAVVGFVVVYVSPKNKQ